MSLERDWSRIAETLPPNWRDARLVVTLGPDVDAAFVASLLAGAHPSRRGSVIRLHAHRESGVGTEAVGRLLRRVDREGVAATLELESASEHTAPEQAEAEAGPESLAAAWDAALATLPADWSDLVAEVALTSSDHVDPAALELSPVQPFREGSAPTLRFRCARLNGYGVAPGMARRCLERVDAEGIPGALSIRWSLSDVGRVSTQGPVWHVAGKTI